MQNFEMRLIIRFLQPKNISSPLHGHVQFALFQVCVVLKSYFHRPIYDERNNELKHKYVKQNTTVLRISSRENTISISKCVSEMRV